MMMTIIIIIIIIIIVLFLVMEYQWSETDKAKTEMLRENLFQGHFAHHKSHVGGRRLTA
jgi:uncharacterized membrane protein